MTKTERVVQHSVIYELEGEADKVQEALNQITREYPWCAYGTMVTSQRILPDGRIRAEVTRSRSC